MADAEAGFGGPLNAFELMKQMIEAGAAGVHFEDQLAAVIESCEQVLSLSENKQKMLAFVESRMSVVCPNLSVSALPSCLDEQLEHSCTLLFV